MSTPGAMHDVSVDHVFETAHRLPQLPGKCTNLHGHSWRVTISVGARELSSASTVVEFGALKASLRGWIDTHLDHATMLGADDPLVQPLTSAHSAVFRFGATDGAPAESLAADLAWPTVEAVAVLLWRVAHAALPGLSTTPDACVRRVAVRETHLNMASYEMAGA